MFYSERQQRFHSNGNYAIYIYLSYFSIKILQKCQKDYNTFPYSQLCTYFCPPLCFLNDWSWRLDLFFYPFINFLVRTFSLAKIQRAPSET